MNLISVEDCAKILGVNTSRIRQLIAAGRIDASRVGNRSWVITDYSRAKVRIVGRPKKSTGNKSGA